jgi:hypothetical protein
MFSFGMRMSSTTGETRDEAAAHYAQIVKQMEALTPRQIRERLTAAGLYRDSGWPGYEQAKEIIFGDIAIDSEIYDRHIAAICGFLKI